MVPLAATSGSYIAQTNWARLIRFGDAEAAWAKLYPGVNL